VAGTTPTGLLAASHIRDGHEARLRSAGAAHVAQNYGELETITEALLGSGSEL
jgi:hypothetical protein